MPEAFGRGFFESKKTFGARQKPGDGWAGGEGGENRLRAFLTDVLL